MKSSRCIARTDPYFTIAKITDEPKLEVKLK